MLRPLRATVLAVAVLATLSTRAHAQVTYNFTANLIGNAGASNGTWTGFLQLNWLTAGGSGSGEASSFVTTAVPAGVATPAQGWDATLWTHIGTNMFTVTNGTITAFQFGAVSTNDGFVLCANSGAQFGIGGSGYICPTAYNRVGVIYSARGENFNGIQGLSFMPQTTTVPEPSSIAMVVVGLAGLATVRRRQRRVA